MPARTKRDDDSPSIMTSDPGHDRVSVGAASRRELLLSDRDRSRRARGGTPLLQERSALRDSAQGMSDIMIPLQPQAPEDVRYHSSTRLRRPYSEARPSA